MSAQRHHAVDPAPRTYPGSVYLCRRSTVDPATFGSLTPADVERWLLTEATETVDTLHFFEGFVWRLHAAGLGVDRSTLHLGTLHPQLLGYSWFWTVLDGFCDEVQVDEGAILTDAFKRNPLAIVMDTGEPYQVLIDTVPADERSPMLVDLAGQGFSEYWIEPLRAGLRRRNSVTLATRQEGGFSDEQRAQLSRLVELLAIHVDRYISVGIAGNVVDTYLGPVAGRQVLEGSIKRGAGAPIDAIVWASDLRNFTGLSDRLDGEQMIGVLNAYFDVMVGAVLAEGGEVLKFIGDGLLAVFRFSDYETEAAAAKAALAAATGALNGLEELNERGGPHGDPDAWPALRTGIGLHRGRVFFGNVGAPARLDFTVIGRAVNTASRVEGLTKLLVRPVLITEAVSGLLEDPMEPMGEHTLKGVSEPVRVFAPLG